MTDSPGVAREYYLVLILQMSELRWEELEGPIRDLRLGSPWSSQQILFSSRGFLHVREAARLLRVPGASKQHIFGGVGMIPLAWKRVHFLDAECSSLRLTHQTFIIKAGP